MCKEINNGIYTKMDADPKSPVSWRFYPKKKNGKVGFTDAIRELYGQGMEGNLYAQFFKVPYEYPIVDENMIELIEPEDACAILAEWCGYKLYDRNGNEIV